METARILIAKTVKITNRDKIVFYPVTYQRRKSRMKTTAVKLTILCSLIIAGLIFTSLSYAINLGDAVGIWLFDESSGVVAREATGTGYNGDLTSDLEPPKWVKGKFGNGLEFDGDDIVTVADNDNLRLGKAQTITLWLHPTEDVDDWVRLVGKGETDPRNYGMWRQNDGDLLFQIYPGCNSWRDGDAATNAPAGEWTHMAGTYDGAEMKLFVNGVELVSAACETEPATSEDPLTFGYTGSFHTYFKGIIDEIGIFNAVLTEADINDIMNQGLAGATGLTAVSSKGKLTATWGEIKK